MKYVIICFLISITFVRAQTMTPALLDSVGVVYPKIAIAIARHETGNFKSKLYKQHNNAFGFKGRKSYKHYPSLVHSLQEYAALEARVIAQHKILNQQQYLLKLSRRYAEDKRWYYKIKQFL